MYTTIEKKIDKLTYFHEMIKQKDIFSSLNSFTKSIENRVEVIEDTSSTQKLKDSTEIASAQNEGTLRYRTDELSSYVDIVMKIGTDSYEWTNIVKNNY